MWPRMGIKVVATCTEYMIAGVLIHLHLPANKVFNQLCIVYRLECTALTYHTTRNQICIISSYRSAWFMSHWPFKKAYAAMGKKGSWIRLSQNMKDLNQTGGSSTMGSLNSAAYHCSTSLNCNAKRYLFTYLFTDWKTWTITTKGVLNNFSTHLLVEDTTVLGVVLEDQWRE